MRLTQQTSYSIQTLIFCAQNQGGPSRIRDVATSYRISELHLFKIMHVLVEGGLIETLRGRNGGIRLAKPAETISLGDVIRVAEGSFQLTDCFDPAGHDCPLGRSCGLGSALREALDAFFSVLDRYTIADVAMNRGLLGALLPGVAAVDPQNAGGQSGFAGAAIPARPRG